MPHTLHLVAIDKGRPAMVARGVREALRAAETNMSPGFLMQEVQRILEEALAGDLPIGLVQSDDEEVVARCGETLIEESRHAAEAGIDLDDGDIEAIIASRTDPSNPSVDPDASYQRGLGDEAPSRNAIFSALMILAQANGNIAVAYAHARALGRTTGDGALWSEVCRLIVSAFDINFQ
jgi:hypothetical protein